MKSEAERGPGGRPSKAGKEDRLTTKKETEKERERERDMEKKGKEVKETTYNPPKQTATNTGIPTPNPTPSLTPKELFLASSTTPLTPASPSAAVGVGGGGVNLVGLPSIFAIVTALEPNVAVLVTVSCTLGAKVGFWPLGADAVRVRVSVLWVVSCSDMGQSPARDADAGAAHCTPVCTILVVDVEVVMDAWRLAGLPVRVGEGRAAGVVVACSAQMEASAVL